MAGLNTAQIIDKAKSYGKNLSTGEADSILKQTFNQSIFGADPGKVDALLKSNYASPPTSNFSSGGNAQSYIQSAIDQVKKANEPAVQSYEAAIPETQKKFSTQRENIKSRYDNLIASIKGNQQVAETRQTTATNNELGRRGIVSSSGIAEQEMANALNPITQQYTGLQKEAVGAQGEEEAANVAGETDALRTIQNAIAGLISGSTTQGIGLGTNLYQTDETSRANELARQLQQQQIAEQKRQAELDEAFRQKQLAESTRQFNVGQQSKDSGDISSLFKVLGANTNTKTPAPVKKVIGRLPDGRYLWSDGTAGWSGGNTA